MTLILIDNYDSFTYNLVQYFGDLGCTVNVIRNDAATAEAILSQKPQGIIISPGPGTPKQAGICIDMILKCAETETPLLGVCLGHQAIGQAFNGQVIRGSSPVHGKTSKILHTNEGLFENLPQSFEVTRYHSLIIDKKTMPAELTITAETTDGTIMGVQHKTLPIHGAQFHPESIGSEHGHDLLQNFIKLTA